MTRVTAAELLRRPVQLRGIHLGRPVELILDRDRRRALGLEIVCGDDERRFLPLAAAIVGEHAIEVPSPLVLLEEAELAFYTERGSAFHSLRGADVMREAAVLGPLEDLELEADGTISAVTVEALSGRSRVACDDNVHLGHASGSVRAAS